LPDSGHEEAEITVSLPSSIPTWPSALALVALQSPESKDETFAR
jgi:hypothetical protein